MKKWLSIAAAVVLIMLLVYGGLWSVEKGITDMIFPDQPLQTLTFRRESPGRLTIVFAGKRTVIEPAEIGNSLAKIRDMLARCRDRLNHFGDRFLPVRLDKNAGGCYFLNCN